MLIYLELVIHQYYFLAIVGNSYISLLVFYNLIIVLYVFTYDKEVTVGKLVHVYNMLIYLIRAKGIKLYNCKSALTWQ
jgi:hypothetical protein